MRPSAVDPVVIQYMSLDVGCNDATDQVSVGDRYGAYHVLSFETPRQGTVPRVTFTHRYEVQNEGSMTVTLYTLRTSSEEDLLEGQITSFSERRVFKGESKVVIREETVDLSAGGFWDEVTLSSPTLLASAYSRDGGYQICSARSSF